MKAQRYDFENGDSRTIIWEFKYDSISKAIEKMDRLRALLKHYAKGSPGYELCVNLVPAGESYIVRAGLIIREEADPHTIYSASESALPESIGTDRYSLWDSEKNCFAPVKNCRFRNK